MNSIFSTKKIAGIIEEIKMNPVINLDQSLSLSYPEGKTAYFKKKIFELKQQISSKSSIGFAWVYNGCIYAVDADWLQKCMVHFYNKETEKIAWEALELFLRQYFQLLEYEKICIDSEQVNYILKNESVLISLFEEYGSCFPDETKEIWKQRWVNGNDSLPRIKTDDFKERNNKHLLLTILNEAAPFMKVAKIEDYIKRRWGLNSYSSEVSKYLNNSLSNNNPEKKRINKHPESERIVEILKPEQN